MLEFLKSDESLGVVTAARDIIKVTGSPGIGKTELCKAALSKWLAQAPGRKAYYVGLAGANGVAEFASRLIEAYSLPGTLNIELLPDALSAYPGLLYLDNLEDLISDNDAIELLEKLSRVPGLRILASSRESLSGMGREIGLRELDLEPAVSLFVEEWRKNGGEIDDSPELREFIEKDLGCHPLTIVLIAAQAHYYPALKKIRAAWQEQGTKLAKRPKGKESPQSSLDISISLSLSSIKREPESEKAILLWGLIIFFPEGMTENAWEF